MDYGKMILSGFARGSIWMMKRGIKLIREERRSQVLKPPVFGCLKETPSINITRGCMHYCVYCYARGFRDAPPGGEVHLYENLPEILERELSRKRKIPRWVSFSTASDPFQDLDDVLTVTYKVMKLFLEREIGISFLTKGFIPSDFIELFRKHSQFVKAKIGLLSPHEDFHSLFEPYSSRPFRRLINIRDLISAGITTAVRIDPIIPGITDKEDTLEHLMKRLKVIGTRNVSISPLVMRPSIAGNFIKELPLRLGDEILKLYEGQPYQQVITSAKTRLLPKDMRITLFRRFRDIAERYGIDCAICGCKNPDLPREFCQPWVNEKDLSAVNKQLDLFHTYRQTTVLQ